MPVIPSQQRRSQRWLLCASVLLSLHFSMAYVSMTTPMISFGLYVDPSRITSPFVYRMLPALLWRALAGVASLRPGLRLPSLHTPFDSPGNWFMVALTFVCMLGTLLVSQRLMASIDSRPAFRWASLAMGYMAYFDAIVVLNRNLLYPYDITALFFFTLLIYFAWKDQPLWLALVLVPAVLNKETAIAAVVVYACLQWDKRPRRQLLSICAGFVAIAAAVRVALWFYVSHVQPQKFKDLAQNQLSLNLHQLVNPFFWVSFLSLYGFAWIGLIVLAPYLPKQLRRTLVLVPSLWFVVMLFSGVLRELRIFSELAGLVLLGLGVAAHNWLQTRTAANG